MAALKISNSKQVPRLVWVVEPENKFRFRYESEAGSHGGLLGRKVSETPSCVGEKTKNKGKKDGRKLFPTVKLENYPTYKDVFIKVTTVTKDYKEHVLELKGKHVKKNNVCSQNLSGDFTATFTNLIIRNKKKEVAQKMLMDREQEENPDVSASELEIAVKEKMKKNMSSVILCFQAFSTKKPNDPICSSLYSEPIANQKASIRIHRMSRCSGSSRGNDEVILLCDKIKKDKVKVVFFETAENDDSVIVWRAEGKFEPKADVHHQVAIIFKTPPYKENMEKDVRVCLSQEDEESESVEFKYITVDDDMIAPLRKRKRCAESSSTSASFEYLSEPSPSSSNGGSSDYIMNGESYPVPGESSVTSRDIPFSSSQGPEIQYVGEGPHQMLINSNDSMLPPMDFDNMSHELESYLPQPFDGSENYDINSLFNLLDGPENQNYQRDCVQNQSMPLYVNSFEDEVDSEENYILSQKYHTSGLFEDEVQNQSMPLYVNSFEDEVDSEENYILSQKCDTSGLFEAEVDSENDYILSQKSLTSRTYETVQYNSSSGGRSTYITELIGDYIYYLASQITAAFMTSWITAASLLTRITAWYVNMMKAVKDAKRSIGKSFDMVNSKVLGIETARVKAMKACRMLLSRKDKVGNTYLHYGVLDNRNLLPLFKIMEFCKLSIVNEQNIKKQTAMHIATLRALPELVRLLCSNGADLKIKDASGNNCIHIAAKFDFLECMKILLRNAEPEHINLFNYDGLTPLHLAIINAAILCFRALLKTANLNAKDKTRGRTPLHHAVESGSSLFVAELLEMPDIDVNAQDLSGDSPLHLAAAMGHVNILKQLLNAGADATLMNFKQIDQQTDQESLDDEYVDNSADIEEESLVDEYVDNSADTEEESLDDEYVDNSADIEEDPSVDTPIDGQTPLQVSTDPIITEILQNKINEEENLVSYFDDALLLKSSKSDEQVCKFLDKELNANDWRTLATVCLGMEDYVGNTLASSTSPALALMNYLKRTYQDGYIAVLSNAIDMAGLNSALKIVQDNYN